MRKIIYVCDNCGAILSDPLEKIHKKHLSINFGEHSGWVEPEEDLDANSWHHFKEVEGIKQFCNGKCLKEYFQKLLKN